MESLQRKTRGRKVPRWLVLVLLYAGSVASLVWALYGYDFSEIRGDLARLKWGWVGFAVFLDLSVYVLQAWRWNVLLSPVKVLGLWRTAQAVYVGLFANDVLPLRPGEVIRCYLLAHWSELPISLTLTSVAIERIMDGVWLVAGFWASASLMSMPRWLTDFAQLLAVVLLVLVAIFLWVLFHKQHAHSVMSSRKWALKFIHILDEIHRLGDWRALLRAFGITFFYWFLQVITIWALFRSYETDLSVWVAAVVVVITRLGTVIPGAPGNLGLFNSVAKLSLMLFMVEPGNAAGLSALIWAILWLPPLLSGFIAAALTGLRLDQIHHHARTHHARRHIDHQAPAPPR